jgi:hypothetical protein
VHRLYTFWAVWRGFWSFGKFRGIRAFNRKEREGLTKVARKSRGDIRTRDRRLHPSGTSTFTYATYARREINFQTFGAGTSEGSVVGKNNVSTMFTDHAAVGKNREGIELFLDDAVGTAWLFLGD